MKFIYICSYLNNVDWKISLILWNYHGFFVENELTCADLFLDFLYITLTYFLVLGQCDPVAITVTL